MKRRYTLGKRAVKQLQVNKRAQKEEEKYEKMQKNMMAKINLKVEEMVEEKVEEKIKEMRKQEEARNTLGKEYKEARVWMHSSQLEDAYKKENWDRNYVAFYTFQSKTQQLVLTNCANSKDILNLIEKNQVG